MRVAVRQCTFAAVSEPLLSHQLLTATEATPVRWLYVLHGIFGAGRNWASIMRRLVRERPDWGAVLVDLREHGRSSGFSPPHTVAAAATDVAKLAAAIGRPPTGVLGHSFGGKVALRFGREHGRAAGTAQLWIIDSLPAPVSRPQGSAWEMLEVLRAHPGPFPSRADAVAALEGEGVANGVAQWISTNLDPGDDGLLRWRLDLDSMEALLRDFFADDLWDVVEAPPSGMRIHFLKAESSGVLPEAIADRIVRIGERNHQVELHRVQGGHWLNADNPQAIESLLAERL